MIIDRASTAPATHALVVGVGSYPALPRTKRGEASAAARHFVDWLENHYTNARAPLASLDFLASSRLGPERVDFSTFMAATRQWQLRLASDPENLALFYFAGFGLIQRGQVLLALDDLSLDRPNDGGLISADEFTAAMRACPAQRQIYFMDAKLSGPPVEWEDIVPHRILATGKMPASSRDSAVYSTADPEPAAYASLDRAVPFFTEALTRVFYEAIDEERQLDTISLADALRAQIAQLHAAEGVHSERPILAQIEGQFDFLDFGAGVDADIWPSDEGAEEPTPLPGPRPKGSGRAGKPGPSRPAARKKRAPKPTPNPGPVGGKLETYTEFVSDDAEVEVDTLDRGVLAISLARQLHRIWRKANGDPTAETPASTDRASFVLHLDAPWGGGKTTFTHFLSRALNPYGGPSRRPPHFLEERYGSDFNLGQLFLEKEWHSETRRPWITVWFNAWQAEDCRPPWWIFYQTIRKGCFDTIRAEGDEPLDLSAPAPPAQPPDWEREERWRSLMLSEYRWRLGDPKVVMLLLTALVSVSAAILLWLAGAIGPGDKNAVGFILGNGLGFVLAAVTGISAIWGFGALFTEAIIPGNNSLSERLSLGGGDPFDRFRRHFARTMAAVRRPVLVVVDDLDRCKPDFIVDIVRGIQTLLRSPRVVFIILGDREWIERAFENHHDALSKVNVGPEQSLGARFVEKAIQMSFILPAITRNQQAYLSRILADAAGKDSGRRSEEMSDIAVQVREAVKTVASASHETLLDPKGVRGKVRAEIEQNSSTAGEAVADADGESLLDQLIDEEMAIHVSADARAEQQFVHLLQEIAPYFPANPRQIKRTINAMTIYAAAAMGVMRENFDREKLTQLGIWVTLMTEWPETWRLLASFPQLTDLIADNEDAAARLAGLPSAALPGSIASTLAEIERIRQEPALMGLITARGRAGPKLDSAIVVDLVQLTPLYRGRRHLKEPAGQKHDGREPEAGNSF